MKRFDPRRLLSFLRQRNPGHAGPKTSETSSVFQDVFAAEFAHRQAEIDRSVHLYRARVNRPIVDTNRPNT